MVRLKHRYILFDIVYPPSGNPQSGEQRRKFAAFSRSPKDCLLQLHSASPSSVSARNIVLLLKRVVEDHFGESAAGTVGLLITVKYFSNKTSTGIVRCSRTDFEKLVAAMALVNKIENLDVVMRCVHVSGTIRKCEEFSILRNRQLMMDMGKGEDTDTLKNLMRHFGRGDHEQT
ncbi:hypothetical protein METBISCDRAFT_18127 [Metschnikowia bicuspidata]|uniref:Ribonuclease P/MRP protein subunit POP5 n=1 Tax=Metschnikowia bicuspidata TaxID=27322 RepID=A0A4P9ZBE5_9ASCO|nr:hypothetical protein METBISCDRAFT_18127 [Metschnikowia bicuspidata]